MSHPHAPQGLGLGQGNRPVGLGGGISGLVGPGSNLSATPPIPAQARVPVAPAPVAGGSLGGVLSQLVQRSTAAQPVVAPPAPVSVAAAAPALDPITSARGRQFTDGFNPRSLF